MKALSELEKRMLGSVFPREEIEEMDNELIFESDQEVEILKEQIMREFFKRVRGDERP